MSLSLWCISQTNINNEIMNTVKAFIEKGNNDNYSVYVDLDDKTLNYGIHGTGKTAKEAIADFMSAYEAMKEFYCQKGKSFVEAVFEFHYDTASFLNYISGKITLSGLQRITGVNQGQLSNYLNGYRHPSRRTIHKMEHSLHSFGREISQMKFA